MTFVVGTKSHLLWCEHSLNRERWLVMNVWLNSEENTFTDVFDITSDIGNFRPHIFCPQATKELPRKHHEACPPIQLPTDALSQIDYGHTRHYEDCKEVCLCQRTTFKKSILENLSRGMRMAEWKMSPPSHRRVGTYSLAESFISNLIEIRKRKDNENSQPLYLWDKDKRLWHHWLYYSSKYFPNSDWLKAHA